MMDRDRDEKERKRKDNAVFPKSGDEATNRWKIEVFLCIRLVMVYGRRIQYTFYILEGSWWVLGSWWPHLIISQIFGYVSGGGNPSKSTCKKDIYTQWNHSGQLTVLWYNSNKTVKFRRLERSIEKSVSTFQTVVETAKQNSVEKFKSASRSNQEHRMDKSIKRHKWV